MWNCLEVVSIPFLSDLSRRLLWQLSPPFFTCNLPFSISSSPYLGATFPAWFPSASPASPQLFFILFLCAPATLSCLLVPGMHPPASGPLHRLYTMVECPLHSTFPSAWLALMHPSSKPTGNPSLIAPEYLLCYGLSYCNLFRINYLIN